MRPRGVRRNAVCGAECVCAKGRVWARAEAVVEAKTKAAAATTGRARCMRGGPPPSHLEQEDREAEGARCSEIARAELEQQQRRCELLTRMAGLARARHSRAGMGWGCLPHLAGLGWAGAGSGHSDLPRLAAELGQHVRGQQESRGAGWWLGCRVTQERLDERLHAKRRGAQGVRVRDGVNASSHVICGKATDGTRVTHRRDARLEAGRVQ